MAGGSSKTVLQPSLEAGGSSDEELERRVVEGFCATWRDLRRPLCPRRGFLGVLSHAVAESLADLDPPPGP
ncbi:hypothetical protein VA596_23890 [Amycolatopsis sp., V23-08]|uniref:Uncharacterized protein n=1 Tax=Amycolatopsis heterodermiae TaxID=3110235 RepID=A0ABU5R8Y9_9PSEU|nr:hypothetical protein [Amycolatopsis sp., V23-08]MEA5362598.1 hypothetical protein [Amycolatopsis sp., V23-08]